MIKIRNKSKKNRGGLKESTVILRDEIEKRKFQKVI